MASTIASIEHPVTKHCLILTTGDITPKVLVDLADAHHEYFIVKEIDDTDKVKKILGGFKCVHVRDWIACECDCLLKLTYEDFMAEVCSNYLPLNWEETVCTQLLGMKMKQNDKFWDWCQELCALNIVLRGTTSHLSESALHNQLEAALEPSLLNYCFREKINKIIVLKDWVLAVKEADEKLKDDQKRTHEVLAEETAWNSKCPALSGNSRTGNTANTTASSSSNTIKKCPKLEDGEHTLLAVNNGCFKCRRFDQDHSSKTCPNSFPDGEGYKKVTATRNAAGNAPKIQNGSSTSRPRPIATVVPDAAHFSESDNDDVVTAVMPSAALGNGSESEDDVSSPFHIRHLLLKFKVLARHLDFALTFASLLDCGAHLVLMNPETADELQLERFALKKPELVNVTISKDKTEKMSLLQYVKFSITTLDNAWSSKTVCALIAPGLCMPIILRLPFLSHNKLVIDADSHTCIDKTTGYDLIEDGKLTFEEVRPVDVIVPIRCAVERLSAIEKLRKHSDKVKRDFKEIFEPIPHIDWLPMDYVAHIKLKDAEAGITNRTYACPRKYREAFQTLIGQHLDAGRICLSSSSYASPCFIIPKADPKVLPRWVNDY
ncbi:hypothetical protein CPB84DRAFT_1685520 [Gymnopilus junonius]|uniref:Uncharacterized protein n=1 Tax=Gymnopilus junonius TaxID=109634 RepID=A0A9P5TKC5_GYMJU|nr:hypothetical protein CPB84DRAFT_1685520 [Gymnopilus junonius]